MCQLFSTCPAQPLPPPPLLLLSSLGLHGVCRGPRGLQYLGFLTFQLVAGLGQRETVEDNRADSRRERRGYLLSQPLLAMNLAGATFLQGSCFYKWTLCTAPAFTSLWKCPCAGQRGRGSGLCWSLGGSHPVLVPSDTVPHLCRQHLHQ